MPPPGPPAPIDPPVLNNFNDPSVPSTPPAWDTFNFNLPNTNRVNYPLDIRIDDLSEANRPSAPQSEQPDIQDPLARFYSGRDDPWIPPQSLASYTVPMPPQRTLTSQPRPAATDVAVFDHHSSAPSSEVGSSVAVPCRSDSGYITKAATTRSVHSIESGETNDLSTRLDNMRPYSGQALHGRQGVIQFPGTQPPISTSHALAPQTLKCPYCSEVPKCRSEYKYAQSPNLYTNETN